MHPPGCAAGADSRRQRRRCGRHEQCFCTFVGHNSPSAQVFRQLPGTHGSCTHQAVLQVHVIFSTHASQKLLGTHGSCTHQAVLQVLIAGDSAGGVGAMNNADAVLRLIECAPAGSLCSECSSGPELLQLGQEMTP